MNVTQAYFKMLDVFAPSRAAKMAYRVMSNPQVRKLREMEEAILAKARQEVVDFKDFRIQGYQWGKEGQPMALLVHGWEGQAGNFGALVELLLTKDYRIVAFDGPSHGKSSRGNTSMFEYAEFISLALQQHQPQVVISHSFGSVSTIFALSRLPEIKLAQWFLLTTPSNFKDRIAGIKEFLGVSDRTVSRLTRLIERETGHQVEELNMDFMGAKIPQVEEVCIIHSRSDKVIPIKDARHAHRAIPQSTLIELDGLGHYRILWSEEVKGILTEKLKQAEDYQMSNSLS